MVDDNKVPKLVGAFIRQRREALGLSQRALGLMFDPPVTTQFISNVERGVTPLPPSHVPILTKNLMVAEKELMGLLEKEYALKLSTRLGKGEAEPANGNDDVLPQIVVAQVDHDFMRGLYDAYRIADPRTKQAFITVCESLLKVARGAAGTQGE
jgi:transcriptional regulator with XRE-family HTH domain